MDIFSLQILCTTKKHMQPSLKAFRPKFIEISPAALGFTCCILLPLVQNRANNNFSAYTPVRDSNRPSRPPHLPKIAESSPDQPIITIDYQPALDFS